MVLRRLLCRHVWCLLKLLRRPPPACRESIRPWGRRTPRVRAKSSSGARWSPDGRWVAFASDRPGQVAETKADSRQIYVIDPTGGEARQVTKLDDGVDGFEWAPGSKTIAFP